MTSPADVDSNRADFSGGDPFLRYGACFATATEVADAIRPVPEGGPSSAIQRLLAGERTAHSLPR